MRPPELGSAYEQLAQRIQTAAQPATYTPSPAVNPNSLINPYYMRAQPTNSLAPMGMYQNYKATGQMPAETNSFQSTVGIASPSIAGGK